MLFQRVTAVEDVETFSRAAAGRFLAWAIYDPICTGVAAADDAVLDGKGALSLGGACWRFEVIVVDVGLDGDSSATEWEEDILHVGRGASLIFADGSRAESGSIGGGC